MALLKLNGTSHFIDVGTLKVEPISAGRWKVSYDYNYNAETCQHSFTVIGGTKSGGARNEWFCHHPLFFGEQYMPTKSMIAAIKLGVQF